MIQVDKEEEELEIRNCIKMRDSVVKWKDERKEVICVAHVYSVCVHVDSESVKEEKISSSACEKVL